MDPTRRTLLRTGLVGGAILVVGGVGLELQSTAPIPVPDGLLAFTPRAFRIFSAVADTICPGNGTTLPKASELGVPQEADTYVATLHPTDQKQLIQALYLLESPIAGLVLQGRTRPFTRLDLPARTRALERWQRHSLEVFRTAFMALRNLTVTTYHVYPQVHAAIGYPGPPDYGQADAPALQPRQPAQEMG
ncbi:MAG: gluconate 2-dehydrogenase subunit 3 family protein [Myxococcota bacterium]